MLFYNFYLLRQLCRFYIWIIRGTPLLVQLYLVFYGLPSVGITQNAKQVYFLGTFTAGGLKTECQEGKLVITAEGKSIKLKDKVEQITFSGDYARKVGQPVKYITERAVFELKEDGMHLTEIAPGIDLQTQILDLMEFKPIIDGEPKLMDERIFKPDLMGLGK